MMKNSGFTMFLKCTVSCAVLLASVPAMSAEFTAQVVEPNGKNSKLFVKGDSYRIEGESSSGRQLILISNVTQKLITILDVSKKTFTSVAASHISSGMLGMPFELARSYRELAKDANQSYRIRSEGADIVASRPCEKLLVYFDAGSGQQHDLLRQCFSSELGFPLRVVVPPKQFETINECNVELANIQEASVAEGLFSPPDDFTNALTVGSTEQSHASQGAAVPSPSSKQEDAIVGKWSEIDGTEKMELLKDGTMTVSDKRISMGGKYAFVEENKIKVNLGALGLFVATFVISGDELTWTMPDGKVSKYKREK
jgi:hypothetical protein